MAFGAFRAASFRSSWCPTNGVLVNGERVAESELATGDLLQLGRLEFTFSCRDAADRDGENATMVFPSSPPPPHSFGGMKRWKIMPAFRRRRVWLFSFCLLGLSAALGWLWLDH